MEDISEGAEADERQFLSRQRLGCHDHIYLQVTPGLKPGNTKMIYVVKMVKNCETALTEQRKAWLKVSLVCKALYPTRAAKKSESQTWRQQLLETGLKSLIPNVAGEQLLLQLHSLVRSRENCVSGRTRIQLQRMWGSATERGTSNFLQCRDDYKMIMIMVENLLSLGEVDSNSAQCVHWTVGFPCSKKSPVVDTGE